MALRREKTIQELCQTLSLDYKTSVLCHDTYMLAYSNPHKRWVVLKFNHDLGGGVMHNALNISTSISAKQKKL